MNIKSEIGQRGEDIACDFLLKAGYKIVQRNYRQKWGEIDIIAKDPDRTLVFIEVKTMRQANPAIYGENNRTIAELSPEDNLTGAKLKKVQRTAQMFAGKHSDLIDKDLGWRIDLLAICLLANNFSIQHYKNI